MSKKRVVISLYVLAICMLALKLIFGAVEGSARGVSTSTGYVNSDGKIVITDSGYSGQNTAGMREANAIKSLCNVMMWIFVILGTLCLIFMHSDENIYAGSPNSIRWTYNDGPKDGWKCPKCGTINAQYTGTCSCGNTKPSQY